MFRRAVSAAVAGVTVALATMGHAAEPPKPAEPPSIDAFLRGPKFSRAVLSPSGRKLAFIQNDADTYTLVVRDLQTGKDVKLQSTDYREHFGGAYFDWIGWKGDDKLLVALKLLEVERRKDKEDGTILGWIEGFATFALAIDGTSTRILKADSRRLRLSLLDAQVNDPEHVLMQGYDSAGRLNVWRVNVLTGDSEIAENGNTRVLGYEVDHQGALVGRFELRGGARGSLVLQGKGPDGSWVDLVKVKRKTFRDLPDFKILDGAGKPGQVYVAMRPEAGAQPDTLQVRVFDFATGQAGPTVWSHPKYDAVDILVDERDGSLVAGCYWADVWQCDFQNKALGAVYQGLQKFFDGERNLSVASSSRDAGWWLLSVSGPDEPGSYYLFDQKAKKVELVGYRYPDLPPASLGRTSRFDYVARDGTALHGYVTRPPNESGAPPPLVVMPHGGPEARDRYEYDRWVQVLASRGYVVFQPNFRGSSGFGRAFAEAGYGQWGGRMQQDVDDGVEALLKSGAADGSRMCLVGASYGGYVALQGGAADGNRWRCVISVAGVSDLPEALEYERKTWGRDSDIYEYWTRSIGDEKADAASLIARSPARNAAKFAAPVLLIHGDDDDNVPIDQSRRMKAALQKAGKSVRLVVLEDEGHNGWSRKNEKLMLDEMVGFLETHLKAGPSAKPAAQ
ncbi:MAG TPA: S9 family peptidase [Caulobacteraceae bacterium]|nr:S9 family peptidase [Caulobacteraceae bacterium]